MRVRSYYIWHVSISIEMQIVIFSIMIRFNTHTNHRLVYIETKMADRDRVYDELLGFLSDIVFQIPVRTFMEENCLSKLWFFFLCIIW